MKNLLFSVFLVLLATVRAFDSDNDSDGYIPNKMPENCQNANYCFEFDAEYPTKIIAELLSELPNLNLATDNSDIERTNEIENRNGAAIPICPTKTLSSQNVSYILDEKKSVRVVIQQPGTLEQLVTIRQCETEGLLTNNNVFLASTVKERNIRCVNKFMKYEFLVLSETKSIKDEWEIQKATTEIPVCCSCRYDAKPNH